MLLHLPTDLFSDILQYWLEPVNLPVVDNAYLFHPKSKELLAAFSAPHFVVPRWFHATKPVLSAWLCLRRVQIEKIVIYTVVPSLVMYLAEFGHLLRSARFEMSLSTIRRGQIIDYFTPVLQHCPYVRELLVSHFHVSDILLKVVAHLSSLEELRFTGDTHDGCGTNSIFTNTANQIPLKTLEIHATLLRESLQNVLDIVALEKLTSLHLKFNKYYKFGGLPTRLDQCVNLKTLQISTRPLTNIQFNGATELLKTAPHIQHLHLSGFEITEHLPLQIAMHFTQLKSLHLVKCAYEGDLVAQLAVHRAHTLEELHIVGRNVHQRDDSAVLNSVLTHCYKLKVLRYCPAYFPNVDTDLLRSVERVVEDKPDR